MSYENAPATTLLATHCSVCARPLVDAQSVELGIGPDCRKKHGYDIEVDPAARAEANLIVHLIAVKQDGLDVAEMCQRLAALGFIALGARIMERIAEVRIYALGEAGELLAIEAPYEPEAVDAMRYIPGRRWDKANKRNTFPAAARAKLFALLCHFYPGKLAVGPKGPFVIGAGKAVA